MALTYLTLLVWVIGYMEFGLALYASVSFLELVWAIYKSRTDHPQWFYELMQVCLSFVVLVLLDGFRAIWDGTHEERFPVALSFVALAITCLVIGRGTTRIKRSLIDWVQKNQGLS